MDGYGPWNAARVTDYNQKGCARSATMRMKQPHLHTSCMFTREVWTRLLAVTGLQLAAPTTASTLADWWLLAREAVPEDEHRAFDSLVMVVSWIIWKERNGRTFNGKARKVSQVVTAVTDELDNYFNAGFRGLAPLVQLMA
jgi:hypothetical protein